MTPWLAIRLWLLSLLVVIGTWLYGDIPEIEQG